MANMVIILFLWEKGKSTHFLRELKSVLKVPTFVQSKQFSIFVHVSLRNRQLCIVGNYAANWHFSSGAAVLYYTLSPSIR